MKHTRFVSTCLLLFALVTPTVVPVTAGNGTLERKSCTENGTCIVGSGGTFETWPCELARQTPFASPEAQEACAGRSNGDRVYGYSCGARATTVHGGGVTMDSNEYEIPVWPADTTVYGLHCIDFQSDEFAVEEAEHNHWEIVPNSPGDCHFAAAIVRGPGAEDQASADILLGCILDGDDNSHDLPVP